MKGSIGAAMQAARAFAARNPGQPLSVVFFNSEPKVALPLTTNRADIDAVLAKPPKLAEGTRAYDALAAAVAQVRGSALGGARIVLLSDGDDVGSVTSLDSAISQLKEQNIRVFTVGIQSPDFVPDDLERIAEETGGTYAAATSPAALDTDLRPARLRARKRVPRSLQLCRPTWSERRRGHRGRRARAGFLLVRHTGARHRGALPAGLPRRAPAVLGADPARRRAHPRADRFRAALVLEPPLQQGTRRTTGRVRHPPRGGDCEPSAARRSTTSWPRWASSASVDAASGGSRASPRTSTSVRSTATRPR